VEVIRDSNAHDQHHGRDSDHRFIHYPTLVMRIPSFSRNCSEKTAG
jgi:hypothetical protein